MSSVNKVILVGNLGKDPEIKTFDSGNQVANFPLATSEKFKNRDGELQEETEWHNITMFGKKAELAEQYLRKGSKIYVEGKLRTRSYQDNDGNTRYITEIKTDSFAFLDGVTKSEPESIV